MGRTIKEKHVKANRKSKSVKPSSSNVDFGSNLNENDVNVDVDIGNDNGLDETVSRTVKNRDFVDYGWGYCTEEHLEELLLKQLEALYAEAVSRLVSLGYDKEVSLKAVLRNGHCYGGMDVLANVLRNSMDYLKVGGDGDGSEEGEGDGDGDGDGDESELGFTELRQLEEYSLAGMVCLLQQVHPHFSRGDAMWCLLMSDLHLGRASTIDLSTVPKPGNLSAEGISRSGICAPSGLCKLHAGHLEGPVSAEGNAKKFDLSPSMKSLLERNVSAFAAGFRAKQKQQNGDSSRTILLATHVVPDKVAQQFRGNNKEVVDSVVSKFRDLNLDGNLEGISEEQKDELVLTLLNQVKDLEKQVNERKDWAHQKAMQAARKLSNDMTELKILRMEREETQRLKRLKKVLEDNTMKRLSEMENALRKASGQVDCANATVRQLEMENAEIRAEMEASKLSASESVTTCLEVSKREKKTLKKLLAWEKQKAKLQDEIAAGKQKFSSLQQELVQINAAQKEAEVCVYSLVIDKCFR